MLDEIPEDIWGESETPSAHHLIFIAEDATKLSQTKAELFHNFLSQILYLSKRSRPDIQLSDSFLCTRSR